MIVHAAKEYCRGESGVTPDSQFYVLGLPVFMY